jgi:putative MATE family efflux protein
LTDGEKFDEKYEKMTTAPVERLVLDLAAPSIVIMLISAIYNTADTFFVGSLGTSAVAGVGVAFPLMAIIQAIGFFFGHGAGNYVSRQLGAHKLDNASRMAATGFISSIIIGVCVTIAGILLLERLAVFLGATRTILPHAKSYLFYILLGTPWMTASLMLNSLLRFQGSASYGMIGMVSGAVINIFLDPLLIYVLKMGVSGAAVATTASQFIGFCLLLKGCSSGGNIRIKPRDFSPNFSFYKEIVRGGIPSLLRQGLASVATIYINRMAGGFGDAAIAAMSITTRITLLANSTLLGIGQGFQPVCGFNYGAGAYDRVKRAFWFCIKISTVGLFLIAVLSCVYAPNIMAVFRSDDAQVIKIGSLALRLQFLVAPLLGWVIMNNMMFQTMGKSISASVMAMARQGLFLLPLLFILTPRLGLLGIQMSQPLSDIATFILSIPLNVMIMRGMNTKP